jgi:ADP-ribosylglycohydrolase
MLKKQLKQVFNNDTRNVQGKTKGWICHAYFLALQSFRLFDTLEDGLNYVIKQGGDTDTNAAITGALFGAYLGYDKISQEKMTKENIEILNKLNSQVTKEIDILSQKASELL